MAWDGTFDVRPDDAMPPHLRAPGNTAQHWVADTSRIREELGFRERSIGGRDRRTVEWERHTPAHRWHPHQFDYDAEDAVTQG